MGINERVLSCDKPYYYITLWGSAMTLFLLSFVVSIYYGLGLFKLKVEDIIFRIIIVYDII